MIRALDDRVDRESPARPSPGALVDVGGRIQGFDSPDETFAIDIRAGVWAAMLMAVSDAWGTLAR
jgi:D-serine deaminase-like pyridoxal phosphate-dependent protein